MPDERRWYVIQTYASYENKVAADIKQRITAMNMQDKIFDVIVPTEKRIVIKKGKSHEVVRKLYPSYVMVEMIFDAQSWYAVRHTPGVTGFIGAGTYPIPLSQEEVDRIMAVMQKNKEDMEVETDINPGDTVRVIEGEMEGYVGSVIEINVKNNKVLCKTDGLNGATFQTDYKALEKV